MFKCPICGSITNSVHALKTHFSHKHGDSNWRYCPICGKKVKKLATHCVRKYILSDCKEHLALYYLISLYRSNGLVKKAKVVAEEVYKVNEAEIEKYECPICGKTFILQKLREHFRQEHDTKYCYICKKNVGMLPTHCLFMWDDDHKILYWLSRIPKNITLNIFNKLKEAEKVVKQKLVVKKEKEINLISSKVG